MSFPRYPRYRDSGVEWLGKVPAHWPVQPFKWQFARNDGGVWGSDPVGSDNTIVLRSTEQTVDGHWRLDEPATRRLSDSEREAALLVEDDLVVTKSSGSSLHIGKTTLVTAEIAGLRCCYSNFMQRLRMKGGFSPKLAWYVMNNDIARRQFDLLSNSTTGLANLNGTMIGQILVSVPPPEEQRAIVAFLDRETAKIDALVAEQQRLIELLKEKRQAVISQAVTKGLDPSVPMKDSGVEWLGAVPVHWEVKAIKWLSPVLRGASPRPIDDARYFDQDGEYAWVRIADSSASDGVLLETTQRLSELGSSLSVKLHPGDLFVSIAGTVGKPCIAGIKCCIHDGFVYFPRLRIDAKFLFRLFEHGACYAGLGKMGTQLNLNTDTIGSIRIGVPPPEEMRGILSFVDEQTGKFDGLIAEATAAMTLLQERRSALISAAVTGKIDVRGLGPRPYGEALPSAHDESHDLQCE
jgi:type I restriction enzyme S subunit